MLHPPKKEIIRDTIVFRNDDDKKDSDELTRIMEKMKDEYLSHRKDGDYDKNISAVSNIVSSVLGRFELKNHMINIFEGISILK